MAQGFSVLECRASLVLTREDLDAIRLAFLKLSRTLHVESMSADHPEEVAQRITELNKTFEWIKFAPSRIETFAHFYSELLKSIEQKPRAKRVPEFAMEALDILDLLPQDPERLNFTSKMKNHFESSLKELKNIGTDLNNDCLNIEALHSRVLEQVKSWIHVYEEVHYTESLLRNLGEDKDLLQTQINQILGGL